MYSGGKLNQAALKLLPFVPPQDKNDILAALQPDAVSKEIHKQVLFEETAGAYKLTHVFNFTLRQQTVITENLKTGAIGTAVQGFDQLDHATYDRALDKFISAYGADAPEAIAAKNRFFQVNKI